MDRIASSLPDFGQPETPTVIGGFAALVGACIGYYLERSIEAAERGAFLGGLLGVGLGSCAYLFGLVTGLY